MTDLRFPLFLLMLTAVPFLLSAGERVSDFPLGKPLVPVSVPEEYPAYGEFFPDREIHAGAQRDLADLRIVDDRGEFVPWLMETAGTMIETEDVTRQTVRIDSSLTGEEKRPVAVFQAILSDDSPAQEYNSLEVLMLNMSSVDAWSVEVLVEGRSETGGWTHVTRDSLYRLEQTEKGVILLESPVSYPFWRITVLSGTRMVEPKAVTLRWNAFREVSRPFIKNIPLKVASRTEKEGVTVLELESPRNLPLSALVLRGEGQYSRMCQLYGSDPSGRWLITEGRLFRWEDKSEIHQEGRLPFRLVQPGPDRLYAEISNGSDRPVGEITAGAEYLPVRLVFVMEKGRTYRVLFGNPSAVPPVYDIAAFRERISDQPRVSLIPGILEETEILREDAPDDFPWKTVLNLLLIMAGTGMAVLILAALRRQKG